MRLSSSSLAFVPEIVARPAYDRHRQGNGIVHIGLGAFARAHIAAYADAAMSAGDRGWMMTGVSLRSASVAQQLNPQDGLYMIAERGPAGTGYRICGAISRVLVAGHERGAIIEALAAPQTRIVSFTVTEKGYCRAPDGALDENEARAGFYPMLAEAMRLRIERGLPGLTLLSCDNLASNGAVLAGLMGQHLAATPAILAWFEEHCTCPSTMVDRIVPATSVSDREAARVATGVDDAALVVTEPFSQWVLEDRFASGRPDFEVAGAQFVTSVEPYESAKLRMLNGAHSLLAYCGLEAGYDFVHEAIADRRLRELAKQIMQDAIPTIAPAPGQDLEAYADTLIDRFENPALQHRLAQIAMDGSQKLPQRWLAVLAERQRRGLESPTILEGVAAWLRHVRGDQRPVEDPLACELAQAWQLGSTRAMIMAVFGPEPILNSTWHPNDAAIAWLETLLAE